MSTADSSFFILFNKVYHPKIQKTLSSTFAKKIILDCVSVLSVDCQKNQ